MQYTQYTLESYGSCGETWPMVMQGFCFDFISLIGCVCVVRKAMQYTQHTVELYGSCGETWPMMLQGFCN